jgi:hypothetical protein
VAQRGTATGGHRVSRFTPDADSYRSDATIGVRKSKLKGNQVYNLTGSGQKVSVTSEKQEKVSIFARGGNDGEYADDFRILGPGSGRDFKVTVYATSSGKRNITGDVKTGGFIERAVLIDEKRDYLVEVKPKASTKGKVRKLKVSLGIVSLRGDTEDRVKAKVKTKKEKKK